MRYTNPYGGKQYAANYPSISSRFERGFLNSPDSQVHQDTDLDLEYGWHLNIYFKGNSLLK